MDMKKWKRRQRSRIVPALAFLLLVAGCAPAYFQTLRAPAGPMRVESLAQWPYRELWSGFVFNGEKVGFTYLKISPLPADRFQIHSEAHMRILFLGMDKKVSMKSVDTVRPDLSLVAFHFEQDMDGKPLVIDGGIDGGMLRAVQTSGGERKVLEKKLEGPLYPASAINLYPVLHGLAVGAEYRFTVFDPQTQSVAEVSQKVTAFEESRKLILEPAFKIETRLLDHEVSSWINPRGETIFELALGGVLITYKETEEQARRYLSEASLNKKDLILDFSLVKTARPLACPRDARSLVVRLEGLAGRLPLLQGPGQAATEVEAGEKPAALFRITRLASPPTGGPKEQLAREDRTLYLSATHHLESNHPDIRKAAAEVTAGAASDREKVERLASWVDREVKDEAVDSFSALEVLRVRKGECQAHAMLYTALARASGIPTRLAGGLVYMEGMGFLYHSWAESWLDGWVAVDPTFNQVGADATHIKLVEGPDWPSILKLGKVVGRLQATVVDYRTACRK